MAVTEETRHRMHMKFEEVVGADVAITLMEHLPPVGWADVATHHDLDQQTAMLMLALDGRTAELRTEMADLRTDLRTEMADLRTEMADLRAELDQRFQRLLLQLVGSMAALLTVAMVVARLTA